MPIAGGVEELRRYLEAQPQPLVLLEGGVVAWANRAFCELVAIDREDLAGQPLPVAGSLDPEELTRDSCEVALVHASGYLVDVTARLVRVAPRSWMLACTVANYEETETRDRLTRLEALVDGLSVGVLMSEHGLRLGYVNDALAELIGATPAELLGLGWLESVPATVAAELRGLALTALTGVPVRTTIWLGQRAVDVALRPVKARDQSLSFVGTMASMPARVSPLPSVGLDVDEVTGVGNARRLREELSALLAVEDRWLARVEVRGLDEVAYVLGEAARDRLLAWVAEQLAGVRVWRSGPRSFVVLGEGPASRLADELRGALVGCLRVGGAVISVETEVTAVGALRGEDVDVALIRLEEASL